MLLNKTFKLKGRYRKRNIIVIIAGCIIIGFCITIIALNVYKADTPKNCGDSPTEKIVCSCGDTVIYNYTLNEDLICPADTSGLIIGADNITLDGNGKSIIGKTSWANSDPMYAGIYMFRHSNVTVKNFSNIKNFIIGVKVWQSTNINILANQISNNYFQGLEINQVTNKALIENNYIHNNRSAGLRIQDTIATEITENGIVIRNNEIDNNDYVGLAMEGSKKVLFKNNRCNGNPLNADFGSGSFNNSDGEIYNHDIDTTNTVEGKPIYYLYKQNNTIYDGIEAGLFFVIESDSIGIKNINFPINNGVSIYFKSVTNSIISGVNIGKSSYGAILADSHNNTVENNTISQGTVSTYGIYLVRANNNTFYHNTLSGLQSGVNLLTSSGNSFKNNIISDTQVDVSAKEINIKYYPILDEGNTYSDNKYYHNMDSSMLKISDTDVNVVSLGQKAEANLNLKNANGRDCLGCSYNFKTYPAENIEILPQDKPNNVKIDFMPSKSGSYTLQINLTDANNNSVLRNIRYIVGTTKEISQKLYFRGIMPSHNQIGGTDGGSINNKIPENTEITNCMVWIQYAFDFIPPYPLANLKSFVANTWYQAGSDTNTFGVERYGTYNTSTDKNSNAPPSQNLAWIRSQLGSINYTMDYPWSWYYLAVKYFPDDGIAVVSFPDKIEKDKGNISNIELNYETSATPIIKSITNEKINILAATLDGKNNAEIILEGAASTDIDLENYNRPFIGATTAIDQNKNSRVNIANIVNTSTLNSVYLEVLPSSDSVAVFVIDWQTGENTNKKWSEESQNITNKIAHVVGDLRPNGVYNLKINNAPMNENSAATNEYFADGSGILKFDYEGGFSIKTFELTDTGNTRQEEDIIITPTPIPSPKTSPTPKTKTPLPSIKPPATPQPKPTPTETTVSIPQETDTRETSGIILPPASIATPPIAITTTPRPEPTPTSKKIAEKTNDSLVPEAPAMDIKVQSTGRNYKMWWLYGGLIVILGEILFIFIVERRKKKKIKMD